MLQSPIAKNHPASRRRIFNLSRFKAAVTASKMTDPTTIRKAAICIEVNWNALNFRTKIPIVPHKVPADKISIGAVCFVKLANFFFLSRCVCAEQKRLESPCLLWYIKHKERHLQITDALGATDRRSARFVKCRNSRLTCQVRGRLFLRFIIISASDGVKASRA